jgi:hypothetical protein
MSHPKNVRFYSFAIYLVENSTSSPALDNYYILGLEYYSYTKYCTLGLEYEMPLL